MSAIDTRRLHLLPLCRRQLQRYLDDPAGLEAELGVPLSRTVMTERVRGAMATKVERMAGADPAVHTWYTYWLAIVRDVPFGAGLLGFKGTPDAEGEVEIGYGIDHDYEGLGLTTEAACALIDWAFSHAWCRAVVAPGTRKENIGSNRVLQKLGMRVVAVRDDANDWRLERAEWRRSPSLCNFASTTL